MKTSVFTHLLRTALLWYEKAPVLISGIIWKESRILAITFREAFQPKVCWVATNGLWGRKSECQWPTQFLDTSIAIQHNDPEVKPDPEVKSHAVSLGAPIVSPATSLSDRLERFSSWYRLKKTVAWIFRFRNNLMAIKNKRKGGQLNINQKQLPFVTLDEMENAGKAILKNVQRAAFPEEFSRFESGNWECVKRNSPLFKLDPLVRDGLLRVGGRLTRAHISSDAKRQIIIPRLCLLYTSPSPRDA